MTMRSTTKRGRSASYFILLGWGRRGKSAFSKYVLSHYQTIDFVRFIPLLDRIRDAVAETQAAEQEPEGV